jgi:serine phosphatase RsbU (regulator of sigma subunit)
VSARKSTLFLYSDGITESTDNTGNEFDANRLANTLLQSRNQHPSAVVETIRRTIARYTDGAQPSDDRTMLALRWAPKGI